jgi:hypothetical protein
MSIIRGIGIIFSIFILFGCSSKKSKKVRVLKQPPVTSAKKKEKKVIFSGAQVQQPVVAGMFYPRERSDLRTMIDNFIEDSRVVSELKAKDIMGMILPHAGYVYSGEIAAIGYRQIKGRSLRRVVILHPSHFAPLVGVSILEKDYYRTPLGMVQIDKKLAKEFISRHRFIRYIPEVYNREHSMEVHLPFLQRVLDRFRVVPFAVGVMDFKVIKEFARFLFDRFGKARDVLFIVSSDFSHHFSYEEAKRLDKESLDLILSLNSRRLLGIKSLRRRPCGVYPIVVLIELFKLYKESQRKVMLLRYASSGDTAGSKDSVVGYGAVAFILKKGVRKEVKRYRLSLEDRRTLLDIARKVLKATVYGRKLPKIDLPKSEVLRAKGAVFVTLKKEGRLRGCIGHVIGVMPLWKSVVENTISAAKRDSRFLPVRPEELPFISIEISYLTPPLRVKDPLKVVVGRDGLIITKGRYRGLLLPQVPVEYGWGVREFLDRTCHKAGLGDGCWSEPGVIVERFEAEVFGEGDELK